MDGRVHSARPHAGQSLVAKRITGIMKNSKILESHVNCDRVQDAYSFRCIPQVHGAVLESYAKLASTIAIEINSATDNPLIFPNPANPGANEVISQGNFHGEILAICADNMSHAIFELASISEKNRPTGGPFTKWTTTIFSKKHWARIWYDDCPLCGGCSTCGNAWTINS